MSHKVSQKYFFYRGREQNTPCLIKEVNGLFCPPPNNIRVKEDYIIDAIIT